MTKRADPIVTERDIHASVEVVWRAITDGAVMPRWFFEQIREFEPERGFETTFVVHAMGKDYPHHWRVTEVIPNQKLVYDWLHPGFPGAGVLTWELTKSADGTDRTHLELTHTGLETFPEDDPAFTRESCQGGWTYFTDRLKRFVETGSAQ
jgi:uncharacterized protein YndB with AHSA1/START domain